MSDKSKIPEINYLTAINAEEQDGKLHSTKLTEHVSEYRPHEGEMWSAFNEAEPDTIEEVNAGARLASYYLLRTAADLQDQTRTGGEAKWADRFTQATKELFGSIEPRDASNLAAQELEVLEAVDPDSYVVDVYKRIAGEKSEEDSSIEIEPVKDALFSLFSPIVEVIENLPEGPYDSETTREVFATILEKLKVEDDGWDGWEVNASDRTMLSVESATKTIDVPKKRGPVETKKQLLGLALHEIGVHATRGKNGYKHGDEALTTGIFGYGDFEEGLGVLFEYLATGVIPDKIKDRYIDIALATGAVSGVQLSREELLKLGIEREKLRVKKAGNQANLENIQKSVESHVNRIFRGGTGETFEDDHGKKAQAVMTKDLIYFEGFVSARRYIEEQIGQGVSLEELLIFLLQGKFDPTKPQHSKYITKYFKIPKE